VIVYKNGVLFVGQILRAFDLNISEFKGFSDVLGTNHSCLQWVRSFR
jgi:hypothetical protein